ncbi:PIN domain-containing protein [Endothiovibrio diazotrophicus]
MSSASPADGCILDASALLALLHNEPGAKIVAPLLHHALISSINWTEVLQKCLARTIPTGGMREELEAIGLTIVAFTADDASHTAELQPATRRHGLSLGDRACIALGRSRRLPVLTCDRAWSDVDIDADIRLIR